MENILLQPKDLIKQRRETLGLTQKEFACLLNLKESGDRTISGWERGEHAPTEAKLKIIENLSTFIPFKKSSAKSDFTFIDLFAGIGGIRLPFQDLGGNVYSVLNGINFQLKLMQQILGNSQREISQRFLLGKSHLMIYFWLDSIAKPFHRQG